jgi:mRNA interferase MazF
MIPRRGEVWRADLGRGKVRPVVIVSRDDNDSARVLTAYVPVTKQYRGTKYEVELPPVRFLDNGSTVNAQGIASGRSEDSDLFLEKIGELYSPAMAKVEEALRYTLGMAN